MLWHIEENDTTDNGKRKSGIKPVKGILQLEVEFDCEEEGGIYFPLLENWSRHERDLIRYLTSVVNVKYNQKLLKKFKIDLRYEER